MVVKTCSGLLDEFGKRFALRFALLLIDEHYTQAQFAGFQETARYAQQQFSALRNGFQQTQPAILCSHGQASSFCLTLCKARASLAKNANRLYRDS